MLRKGIWSIFMICSLFSCQKEKASLTIEEDKMIMILLDVYLAEGAIQPVNMKTKDSLAVTYYEQIFKIHDIREEDFLENIKILRENPILSKGIYKKVLSKHGEILEKSRKK